MTYKVCYWDEATQSQQERDATPDEVAEIDARKNAPAPVPAAVTRRQAKQALILRGLIDQVQPAIGAITDPTQRRLMQAEWDDSQEFQRHRPSLIAIGAALGLDSAGLDDLFRFAVTL